MPIFRFRDQFTCAHEAPLNETGVHSFLLVFGIRQLSTKKYPHIRIIRRGGLFIGGGLVSGVRVGVFFVVEEFEHDAVHILTTAGAIAGAVDLFAVSKAHHCG